MDWVSTRGPSAPVLQALALFQAHRDGYALDEWTRLRLDPADFGELLSCVAQDRDLKAYVENKIRLGNLLSSSIVSVLMYA